MLGLNFPSKAGVGKKPPTGEASKYKLFATTVSKKLSNASMDISGPGGQLRVGTEEAHETASQFLRSIPDSKRFYRHASDYVRSGGGGSG